MKLTILGCYAATPRSLNNPSSQVLEINGHLFLIDCGEGTQIQLRRFGVKFSRIKHIFISHLHGDHFFGLPGLISTFRLLGREQPLHIYGPQGLKEAITLLLKLGDSWTNYPLYFHELTANEQELIFEDDQISVTTIPLDHRVYTNGFLFKEKPHPLRLNVENIRNYNIDKAYYNAIKAGKDVRDVMGNLIPNSQITLAAPESFSYAYCSDTKYLPIIENQIRKVSVLYHESTFLEADKHLCDKTKHSTAKQAALMAKNAEVGELILGHFSTRYKDRTIFLEEAKSIFTRVRLADDGLVFDWAPKNR